MTAAPAGAGSVSSAFLAPQRKRLFFPRARPCLVAWELLLYFFCRVPLERFNQYSHLHGSA